MQNKDLIGKDFELVLIGLTVNGEAVTDEIIIPEAKIEDISDNNLVITILNDK
jgi:hypothetical protein